MDTFDYPAIGQRIKLLRKRKRMNQQELANYLGKSLRTIQKYETGEIEVSIAMVNQLADILETTPTYILGYEANTAPIRNLADIVGMLFELERVVGLDFDIDVQRPPRSSDWKCAISINEKKQEQKSIRICACFWKIGRKNGTMFAAIITRRRPIRNGRTRPLLTMLTRRLNVLPQKNSMRTNAKKSAEHT